MKTLFFVLIVSSSFGQVEKATIVSTEIPKYDPIYSAVLVPNSETEIGLYEKLELGIHLPDSIIQRINAFLLKDNTIPNTLNPFLEWEIDIEACFKHLSSGDSVIVDGFYYQDYEPNTETNNWDIKKSDFPFRIRFAPTQIGEWSQQIRVLRKNEPPIYLPNQSFDVVNNNKSGFVQVHSNGKNLMRNEQIIFPIGQNFIAPDEGVIYYHNAADPVETFKTADVSDWKHYLETVENYLLQGGKYLRTIQTPWSSLIEFEEKGNYYSRLQYAWEQDNLIEICENHDALVLFNFLIQEPFMNFGDYYLYDWDWDHFNYDGIFSPSDLYPPYCYNDQPGVKQPHEMFLLEEDLIYHEQRTRYYISRYGYSTAIYEFELLSEPFHLDQFWKVDGSLEPYFDLEAKNHGLVEKALNNYHRRMAHYIKSHLQHTNHLIGVNTSLQLWSPDGFKTVDSSLFSPDIDVIGMNPYNLISNKLIISKSDELGNNQFDEHENSYAKMIHDYHQVFHKPVIFSESGSLETYFECSDYVEFNVDNQTFPFIGAGGYFMWNGFRTKEFKLWPSTILAEQSVENILLPTLQSSNWTQCRQKEKLRRKDAVESKELQYYITDSFYVVGYVRNRTYNFYTKRTDSTCTLPDYEHEKYALNSLKNIQWNNGKKRNYLKVEGLKNQNNYSIDWYKDGTIIYKTLNATSNRKGELILEFPELNVTNLENPRPILWFKIMPL